jgi:hypothetical protein
MNKPSKEWLLRMAEAEDNGCTSVGGLYCRLGMIIGQPPPELTPEEEAEARRLYAEMLEDIAADRDPFFRPDMTPRADGEPSRGGG